MNFYFLFSKCAVKHKQIFSYVEQLNFFSKSFGGESLLMRLNAEIFLEKFISNTNDSLIPMYIYKNNSKFTPKITKVIEKILKDNSDGLKVGTEYYRIDVIGYTDRKKDFENYDKPKDLNYHLWELNVAVEHENNPADWTDELTKLLYIDCPLKVLIGYNYWNKREECNDELSDESKLKYAAQIINKLSPTYDEEKQFLIILGNCKGRNTKESYKNKNYIGYLFEHSSKTFKRVNS